jgi:hypothetical protein
MDEIFQDRRSLCGPNALHGLKIFHRVREPVQRPHGFPPGELRIALCRLRDQSAAVLERHDGVHLRIEAFNMI